MVMNDKVVGSYEPNMNIKRYKKENELVEFDPMVKHYNSEQNSYVLGPGGDLEPIINLKDSVKTKTITKKPKLYVTHISDGLTNQGLTNIFETYGEVVDVRIHESVNGHKFAFVTFNHVDQAMAAIHRLHLRAPHRFQIQFAKEKVKFSNKVEVIEPIVVYAPKYNPTKLPPSLSNARRNLKKSKYFDLLDPLQCYNNYLLRFLACHKHYRQTDINLMETFQHNNYTGKLCHCGDPALYYCHLLRASYCSSSCLLNSNPT